MWLMDPLMEKLDSCTRVSETTKANRRYMEALALQTGAPEVHWEYNTSCIYVVKAKIVASRFKHIDIHVYFTQFDNGILLKILEV